MMAKVVSCYTYGMGGMSCAEACLTESGRDADVVASRTRLDRIFDERRST